MKFSTQSKADLLLIGVTAVWGLTFVVVKNALADITPFYFNAVRFAIAFMFLVMFCFKNKELFSREMMLKGFLLGLFLFGGYSLQTIGLNYTTASNSGFITGLAVVIVPLLMIVLERQLPSGYAALGAACAAIGLALLSLESNLSFNIGDLLTLGCALCFALHIVLVGRYANSFPTLPFVTVQVGAVALSSGLVGWWQEPVPGSFTFEVWLALLITAIPATSLAYLIQNWAQRFTTPTRTAIIFALEPVFSMLFAFLLLKEFFTGRDLAGAALMLTGMLLAELKGSKEKEEVPV